MAQDLREKNCVISSKKENRRKIFYQCACIFLALSLQILWNKARVQTRVLSWYKKQSESLPGDNQLPSDTARNAQENQQKVEQ